MKLTEPVLIVAANDTAFDGWSNEHLQDPTTYRIARRPEDLHPGCSVIFLPGWHGERGRTELEQFRAAALTNATWLDVRFLDDVLHDA